MDEKRKREIVEGLAIQRSEIRKSKNALSLALNPTTMVRKSIKSNPLPWAASSTALLGGIFLLFRRKKVIYSEKPPSKGFLLGTATAIFAAARPAVTAFALKRLTSYLETRYNFSITSENSRLGEPPRT